MVEDDPVVARAIRRAAEGVLQVHLAETGGQAIAAMAKESLPRFVLLDYWLPDMDGLQVLQSLRADERCRSIPVVIFSSTRDPKRIEGTLKAGADAWVVKPDDPQALEAAVRKLCQDWGRSRRAASAT